MRIVCKQTNLMKYHPLFVSFEKAAIFENCRLLCIIGGILRVKGWSCITDSMQELYQDVHVY